MLLKIGKQRLKVVLALVIVGALMCMPSMAATTVDVLDGRVSVTDSEGKGSVSNGTVTITATGSVISKKTNTITITNNTDATSTLSFSYSASTYNSFTIAGASVNASGTHSVLLESGKSVTLVLVSNSGFSNRTATLTLNNFSLTAAAENSQITYVFDDSLGSITVAESSVNSGDTLEATLTEAVALTATANKGATFLGWINDDTGERLSAASNASKIFTADMTVRAVFVSTSASANAWFLAGGDHVFDDLNVAATYASTATLKTVVLLNSGTLPVGNYIIPSGVVLVIPYDDAHTVQKATPTAVTTYSTPSVYRTLTMANGANITVNGEMCVSATHSAKMGNNGMPTGKVGFVAMQEGSSITINGTLYAWGYIVGEKRSTNAETPKGGTVTINRAGTVYECFQVEDYRGGDATSGMVENEERVFPMSQYYVQNVQVPMTLMAGATENGYMSVNVTGAGVQSAPVPFIGSSDSLFRIKTGSITKDFDEQNDRLVIDIDGEVAMAPMTISIKVALLGSSINLDASDYVLPVVSNLTVNANSGAVVTIETDLGLIPGVKVNINEGATFNIGSESSAGHSVYVYDSEQWGGYCSTGEVPFVALTYAYDRFNARKADSLVDAEILVNGTVDATYGYVYTTTNGANIYSTGSGKMITKAGTETVVHQVNNQYENDWSRQVLEYCDIPVTPTQLKNIDGSYVATADNSGTTTTYYYIDGFWRYADAAVWYDGAGNEIKRYLTLGQAISDYEPGKGYIQMLSDTTESTIGDVNKDIYLDLNGQDVTVTELKLKNLYGMDTATNGFTSNAAGQYGEIIGTVSGTVAPNYRYDRTKDVSGKCYVASTKDNLSFHRFDMGVTDYTFYGSGNTGEMVFNMVFKGDALAKAEILKRGVEFNSSYNWSSESADTLTGGISEIKAGDFTTDYTVKAAVMLRDADDEKVSDNPVFTGDKHFADSISFQSAMKIVYNGLTDEAKKADFAKFADANGFSLSN